jgi:hypothetical protein
VGIRHPIPAVRSLAGYWGKGVRGGAPVAIDDQNSGFYIDGGKLWIRRDTPSADVFGAEFEGRLPAGWLGG